jgi:hypothetical protein
MGAVKFIGDGYYGIVSEGVSVDRAITERINKAFEQARTIPSEKLVIRSARVGEASAAAKLSIKETRK